jgi:hypothetical protein
MAGGVVVSRFPTLGWRLLTPRGSSIDAVGVALAGDAATLSCGPHTFDFSKTQAVLDDVRLRLRHRADCACQRGAHGRVPRGYAGREIERLVPAVTGDIDPETRARIEEERLTAVGRALFAHVAHLVALAEAQPRGKRGLRFSAVRSAYGRGIQLNGRGRVCAAPGCGTLLSRYNPSLSCALHPAGGHPGYGKKRAQA